MNNKTKHNTYSKNNKTYNPRILKTKVLYSTPKNSYYDSRYESKYVLSGGEASGSVWTDNNVYNVAQEDPGLSWVL
jgi:hypothetical protein